MKNLKPKWWQYSKTQLVIKQQQQKSSDKTENLNLDVPKNLKSLKNKFMTKKSFG